MKKEVFEYIEKHHMISEGDSVIVGVSGGADSVCLLCLLTEYAKKVPFEIIVVHVEHGIRGKESFEDYLFVNEVCIQFHLSCTAYFKDVPQIAKEQKISVEEAGRMVRYQAFYNEQRKEIEKGKERKKIKIAVAHNCNDRAETMLWNMIRGSGMAGMSGIAPVRGNVIRPLLEQDRPSIEAYLAEIHQEYRIDSTNLSDDYTRNKIRHAILPVMEQINEQAVKNIFHASERISQAQEYLNKVAERKFRHMVQVKEDCFCIEIKKLNRAETYMQTEVILKVLYRCAGSQKNIGKVHVDQVLNLARKETGKQISLPYGMKAQKSYDVIVVKKEREEKRVSEAFQVLISNPGKYNVPGREETFEVFLENIHEKNKNFVNPDQKTYTKWFDYDKIEDSLVIRTRKSGDYFIMNDKGQKQSLKSFFINEKVPKEQRDEILLLADGSHIVWIIGYRISFHYKVDSDTKKVLKIQMNGGNESE